jgi:hypothetical protein
MVSPSGTWGTRSTKVRTGVIWEEPDEPSRNVCLVVGEQPPTKPGNSSVNLMALRLSSSNRQHLSRPSCRPTRCIDPDLRRTFTIESALTAPFRRDNCPGRVFMLGRQAWSDDDVSLIVASRTGVELQDYLLHRKLQATAAERERVKLGRHLHDGVSSVRHDAFLNCIRQSATCSTGTTEGSQKATFG